MPPFLRQALHVPRDIIAGDHVEHQFGTLASSDLLDRLDEVRFLVIDRMVGPDLARGGAFRIAAAGHDHAHAERLAQLDRGGADAAGAAMDEDRLALARKPALEHIVPDGEQRLRDGRGLFHRDPIGHRQAVPRIDADIFGIAAARHQRADLLPR